MNNYKSNYNERVDHIDKNRNDCRKDNLRMCTHRENNMNKGMDRRNKSGVSGVVWNERCNGWQSYISIDGDRSELGIYDNKEDAIKVRLIKEKELFGEFAPQQYLYEELNIKDDGIIPKKRTKKKRVYCIELDKEWESPKLAGEELNIETSLIRSVANGGKMSTHGLHFKYVNERKNN